MTYADQLVEHMKTCPVCIRAKIARKPSSCPQVQRLIVQTLKERHG